MDQNSWGEKGGALIQGDTIIIIAKIARGNAYSGVYKGQTNSKYFFQANVSCKKQTNKFDFTTCQLVFVCFLKESEDTKKTF